MKKLDKLEFERTKLKNHFRDVTSQQIRNLSFFTEKLKYQEKIFKIELKRFNKVETIGTGRK